MKVVVIGAGLSGLSAALGFQKRGHDVQVLEALSTAGGRAMTLRRPGSEDIVDVGTQHFHSNYKRAFSLIHELGLAKQLKKITARMRIYTDQGDFDFSHRLPWYKTAGVMGNLALGQFLMTTLPRRPWDVFAIDKHNKTDEINALTRYPNPVVRRAISRPLSLVGALTEPEEMNMSLCHLIRLLRVILMTDYYSLAQGTASLHQAIASRLEIHYETPVKTVNIEKDNRFVVAMEGKADISADHVVVAVTPSTAADIIPANWHREYEFLNSIEQPAFKLPSYFLDRPLQQGIWSHLLHEHSATALSFITDGAFKNPAMVPSGNSIIQPWICYPQSKRLQSMQDAEVITFCNQELEKIFPGFMNMIEHVVVTSHPFAVPFHPVGHAQRVLEFLASADEKNLSFCGDYLSGGYMESALWSVDRAIQRYA